MDQYIKLLHDALDINQDLMKLAVQSGDVVRIIELKLHKSLVNETLKDIYEVERRAV